ncbi:hypothetical protein [Methylocaldum gracile]|uniref:hypothetical protein n=1 Tax=unclassified Methylocaldum TaxID=2622260 RepID=UPI00105C8BAB
MDGAADVNHTLALSVVQVHAYPRDGKAFIGSGVVLDQNLVATNCHVTRHANAVVGKDALRFRAASQRADLKHEPCILDAPGMQLSAAAWGPHPDSPSATRYICTVIRGLSASPSTFTPRPRLPTDLDPSQVRHGDRKY